MDPEWISDQHTIGVWIVDLEKNKKKLDTWTEQKSSKEVGLIGSSTVVVEFSEQV